MLEYLNKIQFTNVVKDVMTNSTRSRPPTENIRHSYALPKWNDSNGFYNCYNVQGFNNFNENLMSLLKYIEENRDYE